MLRKHMHNLMAPESEPDEGGSGPGTQVQDPPDGNEDDDTPPPAAKTFSEKEVNRREAQLRRKYDREIKAMKLKLAELEKTPPKKTPPEDDDTPPASRPDTTDGRIELMQKRWERDRKELEERIASAESVAEKERERRRQVERDRLLQDALSAAGVPDKNRKAAERYFGPQIVWDELDESWMYKTANDNIVAVLDGVSEEMPDIFKPSRMTNGGAGTTPGVPAQHRAVHDKLKKAEKELLELKKKVQATGGRPAATTAFSRKKREVDALRKALETKKK